MRGLIARMEACEALATTGSSGSGLRHQATTSTRSDAPARTASRAPTHATPSAPEPIVSDQPAVVPIPPNKAIVTIASIRADLGVSDNDRRWRDIRVSKSN